MCQRHSIDALGGANFFSTLDLCAGYHQISVAESDRLKTAFSIMDGHFLFTSVPFGVPVQRTQSIPEADDVGVGLQ